MICIPVEPSPHKGGWELSGPFEEPGENYDADRGQKQYGFSRAFADAEAHLRDRFTHGRRSKD